MRVQFELINRLESRSVFIGELKKLPKSDAKFYQNLLNFIQTSNILEKTIKTIILQLLIRLLLNPSSTVILYT
jgi:hypothetical protein